jgi:hypothetical protein
MIPFGPNQLSRRRNSRSTPTERRSAAQLPNVFPDGDFTGGLRAPPLAEPVNQARLWTESRGFSSWPRPRDFLVRNWYRSSQSNSCMASLAPILRSDRSERRCCHSFRCCSTHSVRISTAIRASSPSVWPTHECHVALLAVSTGSVSMLSPKRWPTFTQRSIAILLNKRALGFVTANGSSISACK